MSATPVSPRLMKGALVVFESQIPGPIPKVIVFQYNPEQLERKLENRTPEKKRGAHAKEDLLRVAGPPKETLTLSIVLDATDQLAEPALNRDVVDFGLISTLATLEMLLYPTTFQVLQNEALSNQGAAQIKPADLPLTLLVWGPARVVPVKIENFSVTEEAFDPALNPIRARVEMNLLVLTYMELEKSSQGRDAYLAFQTNKEVFSLTHRNNADGAYIRNLFPSGS